ncbi:MAG: MFS transporter [Fimbriimonadaceae bacterium]|nr:MFS transporter [Fimbriimonadaceae bacterium]
MEEAPKRRTLLDMTGYQWLVLFAAWLGWGFDVFDSLLFNYVAPNCVPTLLGLTLGSPEAKSATLQWNGILSSILLLGWATGGILFGRVCDRIGRTKTLMLTMVLYALGTALCAIAPNIWVLMLFRIIASLGIGGEWAAGAAMVAEVVPEKRRVEAGALLYTSAPMGLFLATYVTYLMEHVAFPGQPTVSWRYVFLFGLIPAAVAFAVRAFVKEPERWKSVATGVAPRIRDLFQGELLRSTISGFAMALIALIMWWSCNAFIPTVATGLAQGVAKAQALDAVAAANLVSGYKNLAANCFNIGGLIGTLLTIPAAKYVGRKAMFTIYFALSAVAIFCSFGLDLVPETRLYMYFFIGMTVFGVFGSFTYYLPELFPTRFRGLGAGFCYNAGRIIAAGGPFLVGSIAARGTDALASALTVLAWVAVVPVVGIFLMPLVIETRGRELVDDVPPAT